MKAISRTFLIINLTQLSFVAHSNCALRILLSYWMLKRWVLHFPNILQCIQMHLFRASFLSIPNLAISASKKLEKTRWKIMPNEKVNQLSLLRNSCPLIWIISSDSKKGRHSGFISESVMIEEIWQITAVCKSWN